MLTIERHLKTGARGPHGDIQTLLERLLIEVASLNYRYFLQERLVFSESECEPPLLAKERQVSGIFFQALSNICPVSRPELSIQRQRKPGKTRGAERASGRIDYFATYGERSVALELKRVAIGTKPSERAKLDAQWSRVSDQTESARRYLRDQGYPHPVGIGLLAIRVGRNVGQATGGPAIDNAMHDFDALSSRLAKQLKPKFLAVCRFPKEMQLSEGWGSDDRANAVFPGMFFAASVKFRSTR